MWCSLEIDALDPAARARLRRFQDLVLAANQRVNLTAIRTPEDFWTKHIRDALAGLQDAALAGGQRVLDLGAGAGLPGIPLAIVVPGLRLVLLEAALRKARFLESAVAALSLDAEVVHGRAEDLGRQSGRRDAFDRVLARAVAPLGVLVELALPLVRPRGLLVAWKGPAGVHEVAAAARALVELRGEVASLREFRLAGEARSIVAIRKLAPCPERFPRRAGVAVRRPL